MPSAREEDLRLLDGVALVEPGEVLLDGVLSGLPLVAVVRLQLQTHAVALHHPVLLHLHPQNAPVVETLLIVLLVNYLAARLRELAIGSQ